MLTREIYESALRLLAESTAEGDNDDYEERAPYILAVFCTEVQGIDEQIRLLSGDEGKAVFDGIYVDLDDSFPMFPRFAAMAAAYLAAMLVLDNDSALSEKLYEKYTSALSHISDGICGVSERTRNIYFS